jgi:hypothetical protein
VPEVVQADLEDAGPRADDGLILRPFGEQTTSLRGELPFTCARRPGRAMTSSETTT